MSAAAGVLGIVFLIAGLLSPEPFNGLDLLGCLIGFGLIIRTIWAATETPMPNDCPQSHASRNDA